MSSLLNRLLRRCEAADLALLYADEVLDQLEGELHLLVNLGLLVPASPAEKLACRQCMEQPFLEVVYVGNSAAKAASAFLPCPHCGPVSVASQRLRCWAVSSDRLLQKALEPS